MTKYGQSLVLLILVLSLLLCSFVGCGSNGNEDSTSQESKTEVAGNEIETTEINESNVLNRYDKNAAKGKTFRIWTSNEINGSLTLQQAPGSDLIGDKINDGLFYRDGALSEYFNIDIDYTLVEPDSNFEMFKKASNLIIAGDDEMDLLFGNMRVYAVDFINAMLIHDMNKSTGIDLTQPWWNQTAARDLNVNGSVYFATGDITPRAVFSTFILLFNQALFKEREMAFPYEQVKAGKWTMESMMDLIEDTVIDEDGNDQYDLNDFYGFTNENLAYPFYNGFDGTLVSLSTGKPELMCESEIAIDKLTLVSELFDMDDVFHKTISSQYDSLYLFKSNQALMTSQTACNLFMMRDMENDYGVLPLPKYDEMQKEYHSYVNGYCATAVMIPITIAEGEALTRVGILTDAMAALSMYMVTPGAYEQTLLTKQVRDEESVEMMKITVAGAMYDLNACFNWGNLYSNVEAYMLNKRGDLSSTFASTKEATLAAAENTLQAFLGNKPKE